MNYYISGMGGFIGRNIDKYLRDKGHWTYRFTPYEMDFEAPYSIIHCSAYGNHSDQTSYQNIISANINDLITILNYKESEEWFEGMEKFYNFSTSAVNLPNQTVYSLTKAIGEKIIESLNDPRFVNIRPYSVFGPGEASHRFIPTVIRCLKSGEKMQLVRNAYHDWIYIDSFIDLMFKGVTEIGSGISVSNLEIVRILETISGKKLNYTPVESLRSYDTFDWVCPVENETIIELYEGLKLTYEAAQ